MRPSRRSSEAPEVVPGQLDIIIDRFKRTGQSQYQKQVDERETETKSFPPTPRLPYKSVRSLTPSPSPLLYHEEPRARGRSRRALPLVTAIVLVVLAFLLGGGIGGGIGGALAVERTRTSNNPSATSPAPQSQSTVIVDTAGCPLVDDTTYNATTASVTFVKLCSTEILPTAGEEIDMANSVQSSFDSCLDACAAYKGCVAATWFIFSPTDPSQNSVCFLKNGLGVQTSSNSSGTSVVSGYLKTANS